MVKTNTFAANARTRKKKKSKPSNPRYKRRLGCLASNRKSYRIIYKDRTYSKVVSGLFNVDFELSDKLVSAILNQFSHLSKFHGEEFAIKKMKVYHDTAKRLASRSQYKPFSKPYTKVDKDGVPKFLWDFKPGLLSSNTNLVKHHLTLLSLPRVFICNVKTYDISSVIKSHWSNDKDIKEIGDFFRASQHSELNTKSFATHWKRTLRDLFPKDSTIHRLQELEPLNDFHISGRNGPNGHSFSGAYRDMIALVSGDRIIWENLNTMAEITGNYYLSSHLRSFEFDPTFISLMKEEQESKITHIHSKLNLKQGESWWKERIFACLDFFSQSSLLSSQKWIKRWFKNKDFVFDGSTDQSKVKKIVQNWTIDSYPFSKDLTTATDSIPAILMYEIMIAIFGKDYAKAWYNIMTCRDFSDDVNNQFVKYNTGNPMGAYTSWHLLHLFQICLYLAIESYIGCKSSKELDLPNFVVVGDDSSTRDRLISHTYDMIMSDICEVGQSSLKGHSSSISTDESFQSAELCKTNYINGIDISPISPNIILDAIVDPNLFMNLVLESEARGVVFNNYTFGRILPNVDDKKRTLEFVLSPLCSPSLGYAIELEPDLNTIRDDILSYKEEQFYEYFLYHAFSEVSEKKMDIKRWILESSEALYDTETMESKSFSPSALSKKAKDLFSLQNLFRDIHESLITKMTNCDFDDFSVNIKPTFIDLSKDHKLKVIKAALQNIIVQEDYLTYIGFGINRKDEKNKRLQSKFGELNRKALAFGKLDILGEKISTSDLSELITLPIMGYSPLWAETKLGHALSINYTDIYTGDDQQ